MPNIRMLLRQVVEDGESLSLEQARMAVEDMLESRTTDLEIASLVTAITVRGATADELTGFVQAIRARALPIPLTAAEQSELVDTCGTGGDHCGSFNISTAAALVAAAAGAKVAKHGNRGVTSLCGSADVLEALGVRVDLDPEEAAQCLRETGFMFLYAPRMHPALKRVQALRRELGFRSIFNLAGPLSNPAGAKRQVMGVFAAKWVTVAAEAMAKLGMQHALVVHGHDGLDELSLEGISDVAEVRSLTVRLFPVDASALGLAPAAQSALLGGEPRQSARMIHDVLSGEPGPPRDVVLLNAAAALIVAGLAADFSQGICTAAEAIDSGLGMRLLLRLREFSTS